MMLAASLRKESFNQKLIQIAAQIAKDKNVTVDLAQFSEFNLPMLNQDDVDTKGVHENAEKFISRMFAADALVIASPEYNFSTPGTLKNLIDWVSRKKPMPWDGRKILLMSASPALAGGNRGLWATRVPLECCGAMVFPKMFSLPQAHEAFTPEGKFKDPKNNERVATNLDQFLKFL